MSLTSPLPKNHAGRNLQDKFLAMQCFVDALAFVALRAQLIKEGKFDGEKIDTSDLFKGVFESAPHTISFMLNSVEMGKKSMLEKAASHALTRIGDLFTGRAARIPGVSGKKAASKLKLKNIWGLVSEEVALSSSACIDLCAIETPAQLPPVDLSDDCRLDAFWAIYNQCDALKTSRKKTIDLLLDVLIKPLSASGVASFTD